MAEMLSPGVYVTEIDASTIAPSVSNSITVFAGKFDKGPVEQYMLITTVDELITYFGLPGDDNYNDWYQCYNFLQYGNKLYVARAANTNGAIETAQAAITSVDLFEGVTTRVSVANTAGLNDGDIVSFTDNSDFNKTYYQITVVDTISFDLDRPIEADIVNGSDVNVVIISMNGVYEPTAVDGSDIVQTSEYFNKNMTILNPSDFETNETSIAFTNGDAKIKIMSRNPGNWADDLEIVIVKPDAFDAVIPTMAFDGIALDDLFEYAPTGTEVGIVIKLGNDIKEIFTVDFDPAAKDSNGKSTYIETVIFNQSNLIFVKDNTSNINDIKNYCYSIGGIVGTNADILAALQEDIDDAQIAKVGTAANLASATSTLATRQAEYDAAAAALAANPTDPVLIAAEADAQANLNVAQSEYNTALADDTAANTAITDALAAYAAANANMATNGGVIGLLGGLDSAIQQDDLLTAYELWDNKEEVDIDIVIGNELDNGESAKALCDTRKDCIGFIGAQYSDTVGKKASQAVSNLVAWRKGTGTNPSGADLNFNNMFVVACGNYKYQYDRYNDKNRWVNIAGDIAGLRAQTSSNRASWWASAGLERGQVKNVKKLAFNPNHGHRDIMYKNGINPIVAFPGQGTVMWGQKTLLDKPSSFDRVNVRGLFNTLERSLSKMAKYQVMEFNDNFTRNRIISMIKPFLGSVQAGRGIQDYLVICDESNNTPDVISRNQLVVDIYIKPTYVAEFIHLKFTNAGTNSFAEVIGG